MVVSVQSDFINHNNVACRESIQRPKGFDKPFITFEWTNYFFLVLVFCLESVSVWGEEKVNSFGKPGLGRLFDWRSAMYCQTSQFSQSLTGKLYTLNIVPSNQLLLELLQLWLLLQVSFIAFFFFFFSLMCQTFWCFLSHTRTLWAHGRSVCLHVSER